MKKKQLKEYNETLKQRLSDQLERNGKQEDLISKLATEVIKAQAENQQKQTKLNKAHQKIGVLVMQQH